MSITNNGSKTTSLPIADGANPTGGGAQPRAKHRRRQDGPLTALDFESAFPSSSKVHVEGPHGIRVPLREIRLSGGEPRLSGPSASAAAARGA